MSSIRASVAPHWQEIAGTLAPRAGSTEGALPPLMILLTIVTGIVDAVAYLSLGHVLVANMDRQRRLPGLRGRRGQRPLVAELTTTVLTLTLTGIAADSWLGGGSGARTARRVLAVIAMLLGATVGALLLLQIAPVAPLILAAAILTVVCVAAHLESRPTG